MNWIKLIFDVTVLLFGLRIFSGTLHFMTTKRLISARSSYKIGIFFVFYLFIVAKNVRFSTYLGIFLLNLPVLALFLSLKILRYQQNRQFELLFLEILKSSYLKMGLGRSFRESLRTSCEETQFCFREEAIKTYEFVTFSQHKAYRGSKLIGSSLKFLKNIDCSRQNAREKLSTLISQLQIHHDFRHRSGQVLVGLRIQSIVLALVFGLSVAWSSTTYGFLRFRGVYLISIALFIVGTFISIYLGRKISWKV